MIPHENQRPVAFDVDNVPGGFLVRLEGDVNLRNTSELRKNLMRVLDKQPQRIIMDLSHVPYADSAGIATLIEVLRGQRQRQGELILVGLQERVESVLRIARLLPLFTVYQSLETALAEAPGHVPVKPRPGSRKA